MFKIGMTRVGYEIELDFRQGSHVCFTTDLSIFASNGCLNV